MTLAQGEKRKAALRVVQFIAGVAAGLGLSWVFLMTGAVLALNLVWVYYRVPEYRDGAT